MQKHNELYHYGILGQKWGVRRFQNKDGTLTEAGKERYSYGDFKRDVNEIRRQYGETKLNTKYRKFNNKARTKEISGKISGILGPPGKAVWYLSKYNVKNQAMYLYAKNRFQSALEEAGDKYIVEYDDAKGRYNLKYRN